MTAIIQARLPHQSAHELIVTGMRYPAERALERKIVDRIGAEQELCPPRSRWRPSGPRRPIR
jgi:enoyl-CoA hydratase/carnithine racemase